MRPKIPKENVWKMKINDTEYVSVINIEIVNKLIAEAYGRGRFDEKESHIDN